MIQNYELHILGNVFYPVYSFKTGTWHSGPPIGGHPLSHSCIKHCIPLHFLLGTNPLHGAQTPLYGYYTNIEMNLVKCRSAYCAIMIL
jgi:hypothetical protein